jgi:hypothetical protein
MGYFQCKADHDLCIKDCDTHYEYVLVYVDDIMCIGSHPEVFFQALTKTYYFKLKGVGTPSYHLRGDFFRDPDRTLAWGAASYVKKMVMNYEIMFGKKPTKYSSPMIPKDHPELDLSPLLDENGIKQYQSLISALQWLVTLGRFDILIAVTTMSGYRIAPRERNLDRLKRIIGYVKKNPDGAIRFRTNIPIMKVNASQRNLTGVLWSMVLFRKIFLIICLFPRVRLCEPQPTKMLTSIII